MQNAIAVFGSINMDLVVYSSVLPREGETVFGNSFETFLGGKGANQAVAASRLGSKVSFIGKVGTDSFGQILKEKLATENIDSSLLSVHEGESGVAMINVFESNSQNQIIIVPGANAHTKASQMTDQSLSSFDILLSQMEVKANEVETLFLRAKERDCYRILNLAPAMKLSESLFSNTDLFVVNEIELESMSNISLLPNSIDSVRANVESVSLNKNQSIIVTLGSTGVFINHANKQEFIDGHHVDAVDTTGSGDCFLGALASSLVKNENLFDAADYANKAAALSVTKKGASASMPTHQDVLKFL